MNIVVCDDQPSVFDRLKEKINRYNSSFTVNCFNTAATFKAYMDMDGIAVDVLFMDIVINADNGIELAADMVKSYPGVRVIFITGYGAEYSEKIFLHVKPWGFLHKPIKEEMLFALLYEIQEDIASKNKALKIRFGETSFDIPYGEIRYVESEKRNLHIVTMTRQYDVYGKLDDYETRLGSGFIRCQKSYLVNINFIKELRGDCFLLENGMEIPISRSSKNDVKSAYFKVRGRVLK